MSDEEENTVAVPDEPPVKKRRKKKKRGRVITVEDMPRKVREEFRTDQKAEKFLRLLGGLKPENVHAPMQWMRRCKTGKFAEMMESELWDHFLSCFHRNYMFGRKGGFGFEKKLPSKDQLAWLEMKQWEQDSDDEELLELPNSWMEKDEEAEEYWKMGKNGTVEFSGKTYIKVSIMYGGGSQLDPRDSICDPTPMSELEAQQAIEDAEITDEEENPDQPKPMPMTEEEKAKAKEEKKQKLQKELQEKAEEIERAKFAAETMYKGMGGVAGEGGGRRRQEIHWDYEKKAEPELMAGKNGVNKFISDSYGYGGYRESEMARDQWKDLTYDAQHGSGASKNRKSYYDNWDQDFEQTYKWEDFASKWAIKRKEARFYNKQHYKYEDITPARKKFLEKQDDTFTQKRQEADLSYWAQAAAQAAAAFLGDGKNKEGMKLEAAPWMKKPAPAPSNEDPRKKMSY